MYFVWISEQTVVISVCSINGLVFITETECVYCAVRTGSLNIIQVKVSNSHFPLLLVIQSELLIRCVTNTLYRALINMPVIYQPRIENARNGRLLCIGWHSCVFWITHFLISILTKFSCFVVISSRCFDGLVSADV